MIDTLRLRQICDSLTFRPFDVSDSNGRSRERYRKVLLTAITGPIASGCGFLSFFITFPLTVHYLGPERYGAWMSLSALMMFLRLSDLGLGNGIVGAISQAEGRGDNLYAKRAVSSVFICLCIIGAFLLAAFPVSAHFIHWDYVLGLASLKDRSEIQLAILIYVAIYAIGIPVNMVQQVQRSLQQGYISNLWMMGTNLLTVACVYIAAIHQARIPWLVAVVGSVPLVPALANGIVLYGVQRPDLRPSLNNFDWDVAKELIRKGLLFFGLAIAGALAFDSQNIVIAHILGPAAVGVYAVVQRLFSVIPMIVSYMTMPLWPMFGEAIGRREWPWIARALKRGMMANAAIAAFLAMFLFFFSGPLLLHMTHGAISAPRLLIAGFSVWAVTSAISSPICMLLNAAHVLWFQLVTSILFGLLTVISIIFLLPSMGLPAAVWSMVCVYLCTQLGPYLIYLKFVFFRQPNMVSA